MAIVKPKNCSRRNKPVPTGTEESQEGVLDADEKSSSSKESQSSVKERRVPFKIKDEPPSSSSSSHEVTEQTTQQPTTANGKKGPTPAAKRKAVQQPSTSTTSHKRKASEPLVTPPTPAPKLSRRNKALGARPRNYGMEYDEKNDPSFHVVLNDSSSSSSSSDSD